VKRIHHPVTVAAGIAISVAALWLAIRGIEWSQTLDAMRNADAGQLALALLFVVAGIALRAERWRIVIPGRVPYRTTYRANALGFFFNYVYPARAGDALKVVSLHRATGQSLARLSASAVIDRLIDVLVLLAATTAVFWLAPELVLGRSLFYVGSAGLIVAVALVFSPPGDLLLRSCHAYLDGRADRPIAATLRRFVERFRGFRGDMLAARRQWLLLTASALVALADYLAVLFLLRTFGWQLPLLAPVAVWAIVSLGAALPSAPAGIGVHQLACIVALGIFGIPAADAFAFSLTFQIASFAAILLALLLGLALGAGK
jgi:uncharacterized protein (TIRG00374 family)